MIVKGSMNYTPSGRRRKVSRKQTKIHEFKEMQGNPYKRYKDNYPSVSPRTSETTKMRVHEVHGHTVAIPYNKGAYQVIPESDIKYIGK